MPNLLQSIDHLCRCIPDGYAIRLELEHGCASLILVDQDGDEAVLDPLSEETPSDAISHAVDLLIQQDAFEASETRNPPDIHFKKTN